MKILLLGNTGQVGWELNRSLLTLGDLIALDYPHIDMADPASIRSVITEHEPNIIINATAYTDVDKAESEPELAKSINEKGVGILAEEAKIIGSALIHFSTDYVFDGSKGEPYTEADEPNPLNIYGLTKLAGERAVQDIGGAYLIFRTSWVYSLRRPCFVTKVLGWARQYESLHIVDDQISSPTWARTLAEATAQVIAHGRNQPVKYINKKRGVYHLACGGTCSRYEWAKAIIKWDANREEQIVENILPVTSEEFNTPAIRPFNTTMSKQKFFETFAQHSCDWEQALKLMLTG